MGKRSTGRKVAMQVLYQLSFLKRDVAEVFQGYMALKPYPEQTAMWARELVDGAWAFRGTSDALITTYAKEWSLDRVSEVDKSILRLAIHELLETKTPHQVIIDEYIEMSKEFSSEEAGPFINGILASVVEHECSPG